MNQQLFENNRPIQAQAVFIGQRIDVKNFAGPDTLAQTPAAVKSGAQSCAILFRYGAVVFFNAAPEEINAFLNRLSPFVIEPITLPEKETIEIVIDPSMSAEKISDNGIKIRNGGTEYLQIIATVLAKSVSLAYYETKIKQIYDRIEPLATELHQSGRTGGGARQILRHIGHTLLIEGRMVGRIAVDEKPDMLWEYPHLDTFYTQLGNQYELRERMAILKQKLDYIHLTAETLLSFLQDKRTLHVEWYIVILILFEIVLTLLEKFHIVNWQ